MPDWMCSEARLATLISLHIPSLPSVWANGGMPEKCGHNLRAAVKDFVLSSVSQRL